MARQPAKRQAQAQRNAPQQGRRAPWAGISIGVVGVMLAAVSLSTVMIMFFGMLPTLVSFLVDRSRQKYGAFCVGAMNFAGVFPFMMELWTGHNSLGRAGEILTDPFALVTMFGAAGVGYFLLAIVPPVVVAIITTRQQHRVATLRERQKKLIEDWGDEVSGNMGEG